MGTFVFSACLWGASALFTACPHTVDTNNNVSGNVNSTSKGCDILAGYDGQ